jgi:nicotinate-nucleotide adenylyltransferase
MRLGVFGGTFNPIHYGHLRAAEEVREKAGLDRILFVPSGNPPLKHSELVRAEHRYSMVALAVSSNDSFEVSDIECKRPEKSYSVETVEQLRAAYPESELFFILGIDAFLDLPNWWQPERLAGLVDFIVIGRPPYVFTDLSASPFIEVDDGVLVSLDRGDMDSYPAVLKGERTALLLMVTPLDISATGIRSLLRGRKSIKYLLPETVESFIMSNGLYTG